MARTALTRGLDLLTGLATLAAVGCVWYAFERPMCANTAGGGCSPNVVSLGVSAILTLVAVGAYALRRRRKSGL